MEKGSEDQRYRHTGDPHLLSGSVYLMAVTLHSNSSLHGQFWEGVGNNPGTQRIVFTDLEGWHRKAVFTKASKRTTARSHLPVLPVASNETLYFPWQVHSFLEFLSSLWCYATQTNW